MSEITVKDYTGEQGLLALREIWSDLVARLPEKGFFHYPGWYESYLRLEPDASSVHFLVAYRQGKPAGIFPLKLTTRRLCGLPVTMWELPHHPHVPLADFVYEKTHDNRQLWSRVIDYLKEPDAPSWDVIRLSNVLEQSVALFSMRQNVSVSHVVAQGTLCDYLPCGVGRLSQRLSKNFKGNLRKARNKLARLPGVEFVSARGRPKLWEYFETFLEVEASGWKGRGGTKTAIKFDDRILEFYKSLIRTYSPFGACEINLLKMSGKCIAGQFCLVMPDCQYVLKIGYDEQYARIAPGNLLLEHLFERCAADHAIHSVNLVTDAEWHKSWNPEAHATFNAYAFNSSPVGQSALMLLKAKLFARGFYGHHRRTAPRPVGSLAGASLTTR